MLLPKVFDLDRERFRASKRGLQSPFEITKLKAGYNPSLCLTFESELACLRHELCYSLDRTRPQNGLDGNIFELLVLESQKRDSSIIEYDFDSWIVKKVKSLDIGAESMARKYKYIAGPRKVYLGMRLYYRRSCFNTYESVNGGVFPEYSELYRLPSDKWNLNLHGERYSPQPFELKDATADGVLGEYGRRKYNIINLLCDYNAITLCNIGAAKNERKFFLFRSEKRKDTFNKIFRKEWDHIVYSAKSFMNWMILYGIGTIDERPCLVNLLFKDTYVNHPCEDPTIDKSSFFLLNEPDILGKQRLDLIRSPRKYNFVWSKDFDLEKFSGGRHSDYFNGVRLSSDSDHLFPHLSRYECVKQVLDKRAYFYDQILLSFDTILDAYRNL